MFVGGKFKADHQNMAVRKRKKDPPMDTPKSRTALLQEGENGVVTPKATTIVCMDALNAANIFSENSGSEEMEKEEDIINLISQTSDVESSANIPKLRTALFQGRDDDVTIRSPNNYSENSFYDLAVSTGSSLECWDRPSALAGINRRLLLGSIVGSCCGSCWDRPSALAGINRRN
jgi:hypothetical protein